MKENWLKPIKLIAMRLAPAVYSWLHRWVYRRRYEPIQRAIYLHYGKCIASGPFAGMRYLCESAGSMMLPKLLGTYEAELHSVILTIAQNQYSAVIDVGCAEGYYAVGLALKFKDTPVYAFDIDERARILCGDLAAINNVDNVHVGGACGREHLVEMEFERVLVICDCEGFESDLFDESTAGRLWRWDLLIELHDFIRPGVTEALMERFRESHSQQLIPVMARNSASFPSTHILPRFRRRRAMDEGRPRDQQWLWLTSRAAGGGSA